MSHIGSTPSGFGLTYVAGHLYLARGGGGLGLGDVLKIDPATGVVVETLRLPESLKPFLYLRNVAFDGTSFWFLSVDENLPSVAVVMHFGWRTQH